MPESIEEFILAHSSPESPLLAELYRQTQLRFINPRMSSGHLQGRFLAFLSRMIRPINILEIGTFTGYSAICLAEGLQKGGKIYTLDSDEEILDFARDYFIRAGIMDQMEIHHGNAQSIIPTLNVQFQFIYIDGEKSEYPEYFRLSMEKLEKDGYIVADNVLWNNKLFQPVTKNDKATAGIREFNQIVHDDRRVEKLILPVFDGLMLIRKIKE